jgi:hypothetical protein
VNLHILRARRGDGRKLAKGVDDKGKEGWVMLKTGECRCRLVLDEGMKMQPSQERPVGTQWGLLGQSSAHARTKFGVAHSTIGTRATPSLERVYL